MAKRRKMTLFDVINTGQPLGLQVKDRSATARLEPRRPFDRYGRATTPTSTRGPKLTAAEELANLRRELGAKPASGVEDASDPHRAEHAARAIPLEPEATATIVAPREPRTPRKPIGQSVRETWDVVSPKLNTAGAATLRGARAAGRGAATAADATWQQALRLRDVDTRYLMTAGVVASAVVLLTGTFYVGRMLARRPSNAITDVATVDLNAPRPNVLNVNRTVDANLVSGRDTKLERLPEPTKPTPPPVANPAVFGGRDLALNYVVIARYESSIDADAAVDVLGRYGVKTTVERNLPGWESKGSRDRFYVIGTEGFAKTSGPAYTNYMSTLSRISDKEAGNNLPAKLTPAAYKYQRAAS